MHQLSKSTGLAYEARNSRRLGNISLSCYPYIRQQGGRKPTKFGNFYGWPSAVELFDNLRGRRPPGPRTPPSDQRRRATCDGRSPATGPAESGDGSLSCLPGPAGPSIGPGLPNIRKAGPIIEISGQCICPRSPIIGPTERMMGKAGHVPGPAGQVLLTAGPSLGPEFPIPCPGGPMLGEPGRMMRDSSQMSGEPSL